MKPLYTEVKQAIDSYKLIEIDNLTNESTLITKEYGIPSITDMLSIVGINFTFYKETYRILSLIFRESIGLPVGYYLVQNMVTEHIETWIIEDLFTLSNENKLKLYIAQDYP